MRIGGGNAEINDRHRCQVAQLVAFCAPRRSDLEDLNYLPFKFVLCAECFIIDLSIAMS